MRTRTTLLRIGSLGAMLVGVVHLLVPDRLLAIAGWGYDRLLAVDFDPRDDATTRVRLVGVLFLLAGAVLARVGADT
ncbi:hypothetical protein [Natranaeroarchaeum aerophilus]|uniref:Uncharacterized protein n=1 Tax=Natranaeroarchaeum aerophilus TaxID=2917711 RepID=A0AAE3FT57_9EURY|nr:hypothetical protein [Natranaeroarchaeum aerophilus]MCL9814686.1 hypothetical protein [Natranaeroarchaeum aerophilus]